MLGKSSSIRKVWLAARWGGGPPAGAGEPPGGRAGAPAPAGGGGAGRGRQVGREGAGVGGAAGGGTGGGVAEGGRGAAGGSRRIRVRLSGETKVFDKNCCIVISRYG